MFLLLYLYSQTLVCYLSVPFQDTEAPGKIRIYVEEDAEQPDYVASTHEGDFASQ